MQFYILRQQKVPYQFAFTTFIFSILVKDSLHIMSNRQLVFHYFLLIKYRKNTPSIATVRYKSHVLRDDIIFNLVEDSLLIVTVVYANINFTSLSISNIEITVFVYLCNVRRYTKRYMFFEYRGHGGFAT